MRLVSKQPKPIGGRIRLKGARTPSSGSEDVRFEQDIYIKNQPSEAGIFSSHSGSPIDVGKWPLQPRVRTRRGLSNAFSGCATLGPKVVVNDNTSCYLVNYHIFNDSHGDTDENTEWKSKVARGHDDEEKAACSERLEHHTKNEIASESNEQRVFSDLRAFSGKGYRSIGKSGSMSKAFGLDTHVTTDWALCDIPTEQNEYGQVTPKRGKRPRMPVLDITTPVPGRMVYTVGRTSGFRYARIGQVPAVVKGESKGTTMEWFLENIDSVTTEDEWATSGTGLPGDSGAGVVDVQTNKLVGQLWARGSYFGTPPRKIALFTAITDVFDDIEARCPDLGRPKLAYQTARTSESGTESIDGSEAPEKLKQSSPSVDNSEYLTQAPPRLSGSHEVDSSDNSTLLTDIFDSSCEESDVSVSTVDEVPAIELLAEIFSDDSHLQPLLQVGTSELGLRRHELSTRLAGMLKTYSAELKRAAETPRQLNGSEFVAENAGSIAESMILRHVRRQLVRYVEVHDIQRSTSTNSENNHQRTSKWAHAPQEEIGKDRTDIGDLETHERAQGILRHDNDSIDMVISLRGFLVDGTPLRNLRGSLQELVDSHARVGLINSAIRNREGQRMPSKWGDAVLYHHFGYST
jgi:hypothetical protein